MGKGSGCERSITVCVDRLQYGKQPAARLQQKRLSFVSLDHKEKEFDSSLLNNIGTELETIMEDYIDMVGKSKEFKERTSLSG